jgi:isopentenyl diphosphate isomerase/L-lactate dehydrogenase-like FMN-dependent dehydrogenase
MLPLRPSVRLAWDGITHPRWLFGNLLRTLSGPGMPHFENVDAVRGPPVISAHAERSFGRRDSLCWDDIAWIRDLWPGTFLLKGVLAPDDAAMAARHRRVEGSGARRAIRLRGPAVSVRGRDRRQDGRAAPDFAAVAGGGPQHGDLGCTNLDEVGPALLVPACKGQPA